MEIAAKREPGSPLNRYIESVWMLRAGVLAGGAVTLLPVGRASIAIALGQTDFHVFSADGAVVRTVASPLLCHPVTGPVSIGLPLAFTGAVVGVNFRAGGLRAFATHGLADIDSGMDHLQQLWGEHVGHWGAQLERAATAGEDAALTLLENLVASQLRLASAAAPTFEDALSALADAHDGVSVTQVAMQRGVTPKAFRQTFRDATGLNPKSFARLSRFRAVLARLRRNDASTLTEVAVEHGYSDQPHFVHDFKALSGMTPSGYLAHDGQKGACLFTRMKNVWERLLGAPAATRATSASPDSQPGHRVLSDS